MRLSSNKRPPADVRRIATDKVAAYQCIHEFLSQEFDLQEHARKVKPKHVYPPIAAFHCDGLVIETLLAATNQVLSQYGTYGFRNPFSHHGERGNYYGGLGLTAAPGAVGEDVHAALLGGVKHNMRDFLVQLGAPEVWERIVFRGIQLEFFNAVRTGGLLAGKACLTKHGIECRGGAADWDKPYAPTAGGPIRGSYSDTFNFHVLTPAARHGALGKFIQRIQRTIVRSRIAVIDSSTHKSHYPSFMWHRDESIFLNLRINIPLQTLPSFKLQVEESGTPTHLEAGWLYTFDSEKPHRVFAAENGEFKRIHLVIGVSPWLNYDAVSDSWYPNEFFGKLHPFDMLREGHVIPGLRHVLEGSYWRESSV